MLFVILASIPVNELSLVFASCVCQLLVKYNTLVNAEESFIWAHCLEVSVHDQLVPLILCLWHGRAFYEST